MTMKKTGWSASVAIGLAGMVCMASPALAAPSERCDTESVQAMAAPDTTVAFASREGGGGYCHVVGYVTTQNPGPNKVLFTIGLPDNFNGRYVFLGVGGAAGNIPPMRPQLLAKGYALAGTDAGTGAKNLSDFTFRDNPAKEADYMGRGVHVTAQATQRIVTAYYARPQPIRRYISGCSGGGQMGLRNALQNAAGDFDGFIVGATPWPVTAYLQKAWTTGQYLQTHLEGWISPELVAKADAAIREAYDGSDGAVDGIIYDQRNVKGFDLNILRRIGFTEPQIATFELITKPRRYVVPGVGEWSQPGYPITNVGAWTFYLLGSKPPPWPDTSNHTSIEVAAAGAPYVHIMADTMTRAVHPQLSYWTVQGDGLAKLAYETGMHGGPNLSDAGFAPFAASGAKLIYYHGVNDDAMSYLETLQSFARISGKYANAADWLRVFMVPGMRHCSGGVGPTDIEDPLIDALVNWVENGKAPAEVIATRYSREKGLERTFRLCAEPKRAYLKAGAGDPTKAENWECLAPSS
jgi:feruloyl esterase